MNNPAANNLRIDSLCPFVPTSMNMCGSDFHCKSCKKTIVDFRGKSLDEIASSLKPETCGVFTSDQLPGQQEMTWSRKWLFYGMAVLSVLGFSIRPVSAQPPVKRNQMVVIDKTSTKQNPITVCEKREATSKSKPGRRGIFGRKKRKVYRFVGCPSF